jgi:hypothetical protein
MPSYKYDEYSCFELLREGYDLNQPLSRVPINVSLSGDVVNRLAMWLHDDHILQAVKTMRDAGCCLPGPDGIDPIEKLAAFHGGTYKTAVLWMLATQTPTPHLAAMVRQFNFAVRMHRERHLEFPFELFEVPARLSPWIGERMQERRAELELLKDTPKRKKRSDDE